MQGLMTYTRKAVTVLLAAVMALACVPASAFARTAAADFGIALEVPTQAFVDQGDGTKAVDALVGIRVEVPASAFVDPEEPGADVKATDGMFGIRLEVPTQAFVDPDPDGGADVKATDGLMGIRLQVPSQAFVEPEPGGDVRAAEGMFGIRLEVPSQAFVDPEEPGPDVKATDGLVGIRLEVPRQAYVEDPSGESVKATAALFGIRLAVSNTHTVTFDANGLTFDPAGVTGTKAVTVLDGACVIQPDPVAATWENHSIVGWYTDPSCADEYLYDFATPVYSNFTLFAKWVEIPYEKQTYRLHMSCDDAALAGTDKAAGVDPATGIGWETDAVYADTWEIGKGKDLPAAGDVSRSGYAFDGWYAGYDEESGAYVGEPVAFISREDAGEETRDFWAKWRELPPPEGDYWTLSFDSRGGSAVDPQTFAQPEGGFAVEPAPPVRHGYEFTGWYADSLCMKKFDFGTKIVGDTTVYAGWQRAGSTAAKTWRVTFDTQGGSYVAAQTVRDGERATLPDVVPTKADCIFDGWYDGVGEDAVAFDFASPITADTTVYARWREPLWFDVAFDAAGGAFEGLGEGGVDLGVYAIKVREGATVDADQVPGAAGSTVAAPKQAGWQFAGWYPERVDESGAGLGEGDYAGDAFDFTSTPVTQEIVGEDGRLTVFAKWTLRLDVTVPVSVSFAVDAISGEAKGPDANRYALKSRTVRPVRVEQLAAVTHEPEVEAFFSLADGSDDSAAWGAALVDAVLSVAAGPDEVGVALADPEREDKGYGVVRDLEGKPIVGADGAELKGWTNAVAAPYRIAAFDYAANGGTPSEEQWWQGSLKERCQKLNLKLGLTIPSSLAVRTDLDGSKPITHLRVTVSAQS